MAVHFSNEAPDDQFYTDFGNLNKFQEAAFQKLVNVVFEFLLAPQTGAQFMSQLEEFAAEKSLGAGALKNLVKTILVFFKAVMKRNLSPAHIKEDLAQLVAALSDHCVNKLGLSEQRSLWVASQWKANMTAISRIAVGQSLTVNQLVDMEWRFGVTAADNDMKKVGNTYLQLKLVLDKGIKTEAVFMELSLPQFYSFLHEMEKARSSLDFLS